MQSARCRVIVGYRKIALTEFIRLNPVGECTVIRNAMMIVIRLLIFAVNFSAQNLQRVRITHFSESISIIPLIYGIDKMLRGFLRSLKGVKEEKKEVLDYIGRKFGLDPQSAEEAELCCRRSRTTAR